MAVRHSGVPSTVRGRRRLSATVVGFVVSGGRAEVRDVIGGGGRRHGVGRTLAAGSRTAVGRHRPAAVGRGRGFFFGFYAQRRWRHRDDL